MTNVYSRLEFAKKIVRDSSIEAVKAFSNWKGLAITAKGAQDFVSEVDKSTELYLRAKIQKLILMMESWVRSLVEPMSQQICSGC